MNSKMLYILCHKKRSTKKKRKRKKQITEQTARGCICFVIEPLSVTCWNFTICCAEAAKFVRAYAHSMRADKSRHARPMGCVMTLRAQRFEFSIEPRAKTTSHINHPLIIIGGRCPFNIFGSISMSITYRAPPFRNLLYLRVSCFIQFITILITWMLQWHIVIDDLPWCSSTNS